MQFAIALVPILFPDIEPSAMSLSMFPNGLNVEDLTDNPPIELRKEFKPFPTATNKLVTTGKLSQFYT